MAARKDAYYFSHDSNARNDDKIIALRMRHKAAGYGIYFMILERLRESADYMSIKDYDVIAFDIRESAELIKSVVEDFGLFAFSEDGKNFYSESFLERMAIREEIIKKKSNAGKKGMEKRWNDNSEITPVIKTDNTVITDVIKKDNLKGKERKGKEIDDGKEDFSPPPTTEYDQNAVKDIDNLRAMAFADSIGFKEPLCIHYKMKPETLNDWLNNFNTHLRRSGENRKQYKDYRKHFENWFRFQENRNEPAKWTYDKTPKQAATETTWEQALINNQKLLSKYD